jgi:hypothetical protein
MALDLASKNSYHVEKYRRAPDDAASKLSFQLLNPFLFIKRVNYLTYPRSVQTSLSQNCPKLTKPGFPYNLLPVNCGDIGFLKA